MLTIAILKEILQAHADDALVLVAAFHNGEGLVHEIVNWEFNNQTHLQLNIELDRRYKRRMEELESD
jgi:hypothetical protein